MSNHFYKDKLYPLQDRVLKEIGASGTPFYLTGGTVVGRFLLNHRYSDDLDFFVNSNPDFTTETNKVIEFLRLTFPDVRINNRQDSFARAFVVEGDLSLKIEFVNDVKYRVGFPSINEFGLQYDSWNNILSNKLTALSRTAPKDYSDVLFLSLKYPFNWKTIIDHAKMKDAWVNEINISQQLMNFDLGKLIEVKFPEHFDMNSITKSYFETLARESLHGFDNSLHGKKI
jgi:Nucleotidyl transferase AbiEii toxin, Type IV TA system